jgi:hypothetical protein
LFVTVVTRVLWGALTLRLTSEMCHLVYGTLGGEQEDGGGREVAGTAQRLGTRFIDDFPRSIFDGRSPVRDTVEPN